MRAHTGRVRTHVAIEIRRGRTIDVRSVAAVALQIADFSTAIDVKRAIDEVSILVDN